MIKALFILILPCYCLESFAQGITVNDLVTLSTLPRKSVDNYLNKKGFIAAGHQKPDHAVGMSFFQKREPKSKDSMIVTRRVEMYKQEGSDYFVLYTSSADEYKSGIDQLKRSGFFFDPGKDSSNTVFFQNKDLTVMAGPTKEEDDLEYCFSLQKKALPRPSAVHFADDLLTFDSHEYLVSFFGEKNVKKDVYYFSEKELRKCSILFANTNHQAIFIWDDETLYSKLAYVLISGISPTLSSAPYIGSVGQNTWILKNGVYSGMSLRELLKLNGQDFSFYGRNSEFSYMVDPHQTGNIDFRKTGIMLGCLDCTGTSLLDKPKVSATDAVNGTLSLHIYYIMLTP